jgi:hypothetical protein
MRARLLNLSKQTGEDFQALLNRYAIERFLYRLGASDQADEFILKGAMLFVAWQGNLHRPTKDLDLLGFGDSAPGAVAQRIRSVASVWADDGIQFDPSTVEAEIIRGFCWFASAHKPENLGFARGEVASGFTSRPRSQASTSSRR